MPGLFNGEIMPKPLFIALFGGSVYVGFALGFNMGASSAAEKIIDYTCEKITDRTAYNMCAITIEAAMRKGHNEIKGKLND
jgi:hypothetical protein